MFVCVGGGEGGVVPIVVQRHSLINFSPILCILPSQNMCVLSEWAPVIVLLLFFLHNLRVLKTEG